MYQRPGGETPIKANRVAFDASTYVYWENVERRRQKPQEVIPFECNSAEDFRQFHQDLRANPRIRYQEPYLPSEAEAAIRVMDTRHYSDNLYGTIPMKIRITQQDGMAMDISEEDLPDLTITSSDESVIRINQEGQPEPVRVGESRPAHQPERKGCHDQKRTGIPHGHRRAVPDMVTSPGRRPQTGVTRHRVHIHELAVPGRTANTAGNPGGDSAPSRLGHHPDRGRETSTRPSWGWTAMKSHGGAPGSSRTNCGRPGKQRMNSSPRPGSIP